MCSLQVLRNNRRWTFLNVGIVLLLLLVACGSSEPPLPTEIPETPTPSPVPSPTPTQAELFPHEATWSFENDAGYSYDLTVSLGVPTRMPEDGILRHPLDWDFYLGTACTVNPQLDVVIPAYWSAEVTTVGFDTPVSMRAMFTNGGAGIPGGEYAGRGVAPFDGDGRITVAQKFSSGTECSGFSSSDHFGYGGSTGFNVKWVDPAREGAVRTDEFFIIVKNYFSPATPEGDPALLDWIVLKPLQSGDPDVPSMVYRQTDSAWNPGGITLSGKKVGN